MINETDMPKEVLKEIKNNIFEEGDTTEDTTSIEEQFLQNEWVDLAKQIPLDLVTSSERKYILQCINKEPFNEEEKNELKKIINKFQPAIEEYKPQETIENLENNIEYNKNEKKFLKLLKSQRKEKTVTLNYPLDDGTTIPVRLGIKRITSQSRLDLQSNLGLFEDITQQEDNVRNKQERGLPLSREEQIILENLQQRINKKIMENQDEVTIEFLSRQTYLLDEPSTYEDMKEIYENFDPILLEPLFDKVSRLSGFITPDTSQLFQ